MSKLSFSSLAARAVAFALVCCGFTLSSTAQSFDYIANPPNEAVSPDTVSPGIHFGCEDTQRCYRPSAIRAAYNFPSTLDGTGQTIVIVDAFGSPTITQDLKTFDADFGIPDHRLLPFFAPQAVRRPVSTISTTVWTDGAWKPAWT